MRSNPHHRIVVRAQIAVFRDVIRHPVAVFSAVLLSCAMSMQAVIASPRAATMHEVLRPDVWSRSSPSLADGYYALSQVQITQDDDIAVTFMDLNDKFTTLTFFGGELAQWSTKDGPPLFLKDAQDELIPTNMFEPISITIKGAVVYFHSSVNDFGFYRSDDDAPLGPYAGWTNGCTDPGDAYIEIHRGNIIEQRVLVYVFAHPILVPDDLCMSKDGTKLYDAPYDSVRLIIPRLSGIPLDDGTLLVVGESNHQAMPLILRLNDRLESPAIDNKTVFLVDKAAIDVARSRALATLEQTCKGLQPDCFDFNVLAHQMESEILQSLRAKGAQ